LVLYYTNKCYFVININTLKIIVIYELIRNRYSLIIDTYN
jgi:hypothetical protein